MELSHVFQKFPLFKDWVQQKKLNLADLSILKDFKELPTVRPLLEWIEKQAPTHSEGKQILEIGGELILMGQNIQALLEKPAKASALISQLKGLRYPISMSQQKRQTDILKQIPLGKHFKIKSLREQDRLALSIEFKSFKLADLKQKIETLNFIYSQLKEKDFWKNLKEQKG